MPIANVEHRVPSVTFQYSYNPSEADGKTLEEQILKACPAVIILELERTEDVVHQSCEIPELISFNSDDVYIREEDLDQLQELLEDISNQLTVTVDR